MCIVSSRPLAACSPASPALGAAPRFLPPPWDERHPRWQELDARLAPGHLARRIAAGVALLDLRPLFDSYGGTGSLPYRPDLLLAVVLYELQCGRARPADWDRAARESEPARWLARGYEPSRARWYAFRDRLAPFVDAWHRQVLQAALHDGRTPATRGALDGSTAAAQASRHRLVNQATLARRLAQLDQALGAAPAPPAPGWMAASPAGRRRQHRRYTQARERLAELQAHNQRRRREDRWPVEKVVVSLSEPEAALGRDKLKVYRPLYNVQLLLDLDSPFILGWEAFAQPTDAGTLAPLLARTEAAVGHGVQALLVDAGYASGPQLAEAEAAHVAVYAPWQSNDYSGDRPGAQLPKSAFRWEEAEQTYTCPQGKRLVYEGRSTEQRGEQVCVRLRYRCPPVHCRGCPLAAACAKNPQAGRTLSRNLYEAEVERLRQRMATPEGKALYRLRKQVVERAYADLKEHRGLRRFSGRGLRRVRTEVGLRVLAFNLVALLKGPVAVSAPRAGTATTEGIKT